MRCLDSTKANGCRRKRLRFRHQSYYLSGVASHIQSQRWLKVASHVIFCSSQSHSIWRLTLITKAWTGHWSQLSGFCYHSCSRPYRGRPTKAWKTRTSMLAWINRQLINAASYRPISLLSVCYKLLERLTLHRISPDVEDLLSPDPVSYTHLTLPTILRV